MKRNKFGGNLCPQESLDQGVTGETCVPRERIKLLILGEQNGGKTQSAKAFINDQPIYNDMLISLYHKSIDEVLVTILDTDSKLNNGLTFIPLSDVDKVLIFTNLSIPNSLERVNNWLGFCKKYIPLSVPIFIIGTAKKNNRMTEINLEELEQCDKTIYAININQDTEILEMYQGVINDNTGHDDSVNHDDNTM